MPAHPAAGEYLQQLMNQQPKRSTLFRRPGVCRASPTVQTAFIADSDTAGIKTFCVCTDYDLLTTKPEDAANGKQAE